MAMTLHYSGILCISALIANILVFNACPVSGAAVLIIYDACPVSESAVIFFGTRTFSPGSSYFL
jgi:hypothetical protein